MSKHPYDKVRKIEQKIGSVELEKQKTDRQMVERAINFLEALKNPLKRIGEIRSQRVANPDFVAPEAVEITRFEQKNRTDRWSKTVYGPGDYGSGQAKITVQDPQDPDDILIDPIHTYSSGPSANHVRGEEERETHPVKISQLVVDDVEIEVPNEDPK